MLGDAPRAPSGRCRPRMAAPRRGAPTIVGRACLGRPRSSPRWRRNVRPCMGGWHAGNRVIVIDNGSGRVPLPARCIASENLASRSCVERRIELAARRSSPCLIIDACRSVWDESLHEAVHGPAHRFSTPTTRREGSAAPKGWHCGLCFMIIPRAFGRSDRSTRRFPPGIRRRHRLRHRAWELGVELSPSGRARRPLGFHLVIEAIRRLSLCTPY